MNLSKYVFLVYSVSILMVSQSYANPKRTVFEKALLGISGVYTVAVVGLLESNYVDCRIDGRFPYYEPKVVVWDAANPRPNPDFYKSELVISGLESQIERDFRQDFSHYGQPKGVTMAIEEGGNVFHFAARHYEDNKSQLNFLRKVLVRKGGCMGSQEYLNSFVRVAIDATDDDGNTPLHLAFERGHNEVIKAFLYLGANPMIKDKEGNMLWDKLTAEQQRVSLGLSSEEELDSLVEQNWR